MFLRYAEIKMRGQKEEALDFLMYFFLFEVSNRSVLGKIMVDYNFVFKFSKDKD